MSDNDLQIIMDKFEKRLDQRSQVQEQYMYSLDKNIQKLSEKVDSVHDDVIKMKVTGEKSCEDAKEMSKRVDTLEIGYKSLDGWKWFIVGGLAVISSLVLPLVVYIWNNKANMESTVDSSVRKVLSEYEQMKKITLKPKVKKVLNLKKKGLKIKNLGTKYA